MEELSYEDLKEVWKSTPLVVTLLYTPICGTCIVAKKMLSVICAMLPQIKGVQLNLNYCVELAEDYEVMAVPCILIHKQGECVEKVYKIESVPNLYKIIDSYL